MTFTQEAIASESKAVATAFKTCRERALKQQQGAVTVLQI